MKNDKLCGTFIGLSSIGLFQRKSNKDGATKLNMEISIFCEPSIMYITQNTHDVLKFSKNSLVSNNK